LTKIYWPFPNTATPALPDVDDAERRGREQLAYHLNLGLKIIVATQADRTPNELLREIAAGYVQDGRLRVCQVKQPFVVLRETTFEDWLGNSPRNIPGAMPTKAAAIAGGFRFYEVTTD
jgi:hypothetical protein